MNELERGQFYNDISGLDQLRQEAHNNNGDRATALKVARKFEGIFLQMMLKSMRDANSVFEEDNPLSSHYTRFYRDMSDQQLTQDLSSNGSLGLAEVMVDQLFPQASKQVPASVVRGGGNLPDVGKQPPLAKASDDAEPATPLNTPATPVANAHVPAVTDERTDGGKAAAPAVAPELNQRVTDRGRFHEHQDFVKTLLPLARTASKALGVAPEALIAQAALETGWGNKIIKNADGTSSFNLFNIKADQRWQGPSTTVTTTEFEQGQPVRKPAAFRRYQNFAQSVSDYVDFVKKSDRYQHAVHQTSNPEQYLHSLHQAGYATDPNYAQKVISIMHKIKGLVAQ